MQVPGPWGTDDLNLAVVSQQSGSSDYTLSLGSDGWFSGTYDADINANTTRTFTVSHLMGLIRQIPVIFPLCMDIRRCGSLWLRTSLSPSIRIIRLLEFRPLRRSRLPVEALP